MTTAIYTDGGTPVARIQDDSLSDGSKAWTLFLGDRSIDCLDQKRAEKAILMIHAAIKIASAIDPIML